MNYPILSYLAKKNNILTAKIFLADSLGNNEITQLASFKGTYDELKDYMQELQRSLKGSKNNIMLEEKHYKRIIISSENNFFHYCYYSL